MGTAVYILCGDVSNPASFIQCVRTNVAEARYVATATGAYEGIVVLDLPNGSNLGAIRTAITNCGGTNQKVVRWSGRDQLKFSPVRAAARWCAVNVVTGADPGTVADDMVARARAAGATTADAAVVQVQDGSIDILADIEAGDDATADRAVTAAGQAPNLGSMATSSVTNRWMRSAN